MTGTLVLICNNMHVTEAEVWDVTEEADCYNFLTGSDAHYCSQCESPDLTQLAIYVEKSPS